MSEQPPGPDEKQVHERESAEVALRVVRGNPRAEELAALVAVVAARSAGETDPPAPVRSLWASPRLRSGHHPAPGAWRASSLPR